MSNLIKEERDYRYRIQIILARTDRNHYFSFLCHQCGYPVCEIAGARILAASDVMDTVNNDKISVGVRCDGRFQGGKCRIWYYISLS